MRTIRTYQWVNSTDKTYVESSGVNLTDAFGRLSAIDKAAATTGLTYIKVNGVAL